MGVYQILSDGAKVEEITFQGTKVKHGPLRDEGRFKLESLNTRMNQEVIFKVFTEEL
jgi:hypothetical protein